MGGWGVVQEKPLEVDKSCVAVRGHTFLVGISWGIWCSTAPIKDCILQSFLCLLGLHWIANCSWMLHAQQTLTFQGQLPRPVCCMLLITELLCQIYILWNLVFLKSPQQPSPLTQIKHKETKICSKPPLNINCDNRGCASLGNEDSSVDPG